MTPAERAVIDAAIHWSGHDRGWMERDPAGLQEAVRDLLGERAEPAAPDNTLRPWAEVVTEDEVFSTETKRWYRVLSTEVKGNPVKIEVWMEGVRVPFLVEPGKLVPVRRSGMGRAVDMWTGAEVMKSGPTDA